MTPHAGERGKEKEKLGSRLFKDLEVKERQETETERKSKSKKQKKQKKFECGRLVITIIRVVVVPPPPGAIIHSFQLEVRKHGKCRDYYYRCRRRTVVCRTSFLTG